MDVFVVFRPERSTEFIMYINYRSILASNPRRVSHFPVFTNLKCER